MEECIVCEMYKGELMLEPRSRTAIAWGDHLKSGHANLELAYTMTNMMGAAFMVIEDAKKVLCG